MFQLAAKFEIDLSIENGRIIRRLLKRLQKSINLCPNGDFLGFEILFYFGLDGIDRLLNLITTDLCFLILGIDRDSS
jgi:hypothetical protein